MTKPTFAGQLPCRPDCKHGAYRSADRTNRCLGCGLIAPSDCNCYHEATIWKIIPQLFN